MYTAILEISSVDAFQSGLDKLNEWANERMVTQYRYKKCSVGPITYRRQPNSLIAHPGYSRLVPCNQSYCTMHLKYSDLGFIVDHKLRCAALRCASQAIMHPLLKKLSNVHFTIFKVLRSFLAHWRLPCPRTSFVLFSYRGTGLY